MYNWFRRLFAHTSVKKSHTDLFLFFRLFLWPLPLAVGLHMRDDLPSCPFNLMQFKPPIA